MILGPVSYLDCIVFCIFLAPQLILHVGLFETTWTALKALPFLAFELPVSILRERLLVSRAKRSAFVQRASPFEDLVIRCVRYAFANIPPKVGRVFFSKQVALPFLRWRLLRHGYLKSPVHWHEYKEARFKGVWAIADPMKRPDVIIYYAHGGGFSMGSTYFYLEFLLSWQSLLVEAGYKNPAIFGLDYTLVPDASFPTQLQEVVNGYAHVLHMAQDPSIVCVSGDSAGATLILSLLLHIKDPTLAARAQGIPGVSLRLDTPGMAVLVSPWPTLVPKWRYKNTLSDYLDADTLEVYGLQYAGSRANLSNPLASPGTCRDVAWWNSASPSEGIFIAYGAEEVFAPEIRELVKLLDKAGVLIGSQVEEGGIHAWPVASLFLSNTAEKRFKGLKTIVSKIRERIPLK